MGERLFGRFSLPALCILAILLLGCAVTAPSRFYILEPFAGADSAAEVQGAGEKLTIGIGPVSIPGYLNRPQIVRRAGENELLLAEFDRWAEPLKDNIPIVLVENLRALLGPEGISIIPWRGSSRIDYRLTVDIIRFDITVAGEASLVARWSVFGRGKKKIKPLSKTISLHASSGGEGFNAGVSALNRTLEEFSREIARTLKGLPE